MNRTKGYTLVELLIAIAMGAILLSVGCQMIGFGVGGYYSTAHADKYRCVKTYTYVNGGEGETVTSKRVDLRPLAGGPVLTFECNDSYRAGVYNSATLFAQFEAGKNYEVSTIGTRREGIMFSWFPLIKSVTEISDQPE